MAFNINEIKSQLTFGGAKASLFQVAITNPINGIADLKTPFMVQAAQIPEATMGVIEVPYFGRKVKIAGDRTFAEWTVTIINDTDFIVRDAMERWMNGINGHTTNAGLVNPIDYQADLVVEQLDRDESVIKKYTFRGAFPTNIDPIDLNYDNTGAIEEFAVEFQIQYWESNTTS